MYLHFMELKGSLLCSRQSPLHVILSNIPCYHCQCNPVYIIIQIINQVVVRGTENQLLCDVAVTSIITLIYFQLFHCVEYRQMH